MKIDLDEFLADKELIRLWPEWTSSGLWFPLDCGNPAVCGMIHEDDLEISDELKRRLVDWHTHWDKQDPSAIFTDGSQPAFLAEGLEVARLLSKELGSGVAVEYALVFAEDSLHENGSDEDKLQDLYALFHEGRCVAVYPELGPRE
ncbi:MAG: hypothetical protein AB7V40_11175 [Methyloceanibacter sp.]